MNQYNDDYSILITCSGIGSRLKKLTSRQNKALIPINGKPVISYILDSYSEAIPLVITLGYKGDDIANYISSHYPKRKVTFVFVDPYEGTGSSLGYSMLQAKQYLQKPFIFHASDTIVTGNIPSPVEENWNGGSQGKDTRLFTPLSYSSFIVENDYIKTISHKGTNIFDYFHIGLVGIKDYMPFWHYLDKAYKAAPFDQTLNDVSAINLMLANKYSFRVKIFSQWADTGNLSTLDFARKTFLKK